MVTTVLEAHRTKPLENLIKEIRQFKNSLISKSEAELKVLANSLYQIVGEVRVFYESKFIRGDSLPLLLIAYESALESENHPENFKPEIFDTMVEKLDHAAKHPNLNPAWVTENIVSYFEKKGIHGDYVKREYSKNF